jgi:Skp family chaperone for outer membrane proteins
MFVASLNLDLFFKKVFSNKRVAKKFIEDLLNVKITEIEFLSVENKLTDESVFVKFDFRCKIRGQYVVIEMQQSYKTDIIKRFYLYHSVSTTLQLETLKPTKLIKPNGDFYIEKNYSGLEPVITLIWMVDDMLGFKEDFIVYSTLPEAAKDFITDANLWAKPFDEILDARKKTLKVLENKSKGLDFFAQNRIIYIFQKNIVKNKRIDLPYYRWFDFAQMSRNPNNKEEDFTQYKKDKDMAEVISRLRKDKLTPEEFKYVSDFPMYELLYERMRQDHEAEMKRRAKLIERAEKKTEVAEQKITQAEQTIKQEKQKAEQEKQKAEQEKQKAEQEKQKAEQEKQKADLLQNRIINIVKRLLDKGDSIAVIADTLALSIEETTELISKIKESH